MAQGRLQELALLCRPIESDLAKTMTMTADYDRGNGPRKWTYLKDRKAPLWHSYLNKW